MLFGSKDDIATTRLLISSSFQDDEMAEIKPLLSRTLSYTDTITSTTPSTTFDWNSYQQKRRRRSPSENSLSSHSDGGDRNQPLRQVRRAAADTYIITRLSFKLLKYLG